MLVIRRIGKRRSPRLMRGSKKTREQEKAREQEKVVVAAGRLRLGMVLATAHWADAFPVLHLAAKCRERLLAFSEETV